MIRIVGHSLGSTTAEKLAQYNLNAGIASAHFGQVDAAIELLARAHHVLAFNGVPREEYPYLSSMVYLEDQIQLLGERTTEGGLQF